MDFLFFLVWVFSLFRFFVFFLRTDCSGQLITKYLLSFVLAFVISTSFLVWFIQSREAFKFIPLIVTLAISFLCNKKNAQLVLLYIEKEKENKNKKIEKIKSFNNPIKNETSSETESKQDKKKTNHLATQGASSGVYQISYLNADGGLTNRIISSIRLNDSSIECYCHLNSDVRTFRLVRIGDTVTYLKTGEIIDKINWIKSLRD